MTPHQSCLTDVALVSGHNMQYIKSSALWMMELLSWLGLVSSSDPSLELPQRCSSGERSHHAIYYRFSALIMQFIKGLVLWMVGCLIDVA